MTDRVGKDWRGKDVYRKNGGKTKADDQKHRKLRILVYFALFPGDDSLFFGSDVVHPLDQFHEMELF
jgi:hypothetical protein